MNLKKYMCRGSLSALIALALTHSAFAMPTGGEVVRGDVTLQGGTWVEPANNAVISAANDGVINWQSFGIGNGETLNFDIAEDATLVNQVTGTHLSELLGTMNQTGKGAIVIVNPNGIYVGKDAVLDVRDLTLSALAVMEDGNQRVLSKTVGKALVHVDGGAHITASRSIDIYAGKVQVADGVIFDIGTEGDGNRSELRIKAADEIAWTLNGNRSSAIIEKMTHHEGNNVTFRGAANMHGTLFQTVNIGGASLTVEQAKIYGNEFLNTTLYAAGTVVHDESSNDAREFLDAWTATGANVLQVDGFDFKGQTLNLRGGNTFLKNSAIEAETLQMMGVSKSSSMGYDSYGVVTDIEASPAHATQISATTVKASDVTIRSGKVYIEGDASFAAPDPEVGGTLFIGAGSAASNDRTETYVNTAAEGNDVVLYGKITGFGVDQENPITVIGRTIYLDRDLIVGIGNHRFASSMRLAAGEDPVIQEPILRYTPLMDDAVERHERFIVRSLHDALRATEPDSVGYDSLEETVSEDAISFA